MAVATDEKRVDYWLDLHAKQALLQRLRAEQDGLSRHASPQLRALLVGRIADVEREVVAGLGPEP